MKFFKTATIAIAMTFSWTSIALSSVDWEITHTMKPEAAPLDIASSVDGKWIFVLGEGGKLSIYAADGSLNGTLKVDPTMDCIAVSGLQPAGIEDKIYLSSNKGKTVQEIAISFSVRIDTQDAPFVGPADAPVEIVEFSDFECPYCSQVGPLLEEILEHNPNTVKIAFKQFPLSFHKNARAAALASLAARNQGKFWEFYDRLFENHKSLSPEKIQTIAKDLHLDMQKFNADMHSPALAQQLNKDINDARKAGVRGTPTIFINGRRLKNRNVEAIQRMINEELAKKKKAAQ